MQMSKRECLFVVSGSLYYLEKKRRHTVLLIDETDVKTTTWYGLRMRKAKRKELHAYKHKMRNNGGLVVLNVSETIAGWDEKAKKTAISRHPP